MKRLKNFSKGIVTTLILVMVMNLGLSFAPLLNDAPLVPNAYAQICDPDIQDCSNFDTEESPNEGEEGGEASQGEDTVLDQKTMDEIISDVTKKVAVGHRIFAPFINWFAFQIGNFLGNDYIYQGNMGKMLQQIWVISRNLVNIAFVFILLWLAIKTIFWPESGYDELKKKLLIFAALLVGVNFSWLGTKVLLDSANVVTHAVFAIPSGLSNPANDGGGSFAELEPCSVNNISDKPIQGACYPTAIITPVDSGLDKVFYFQAEEGEEDGCAKMTEAYAELYNDDGSEKPETLSVNEKYRGNTSICMENLNFFKYNQNTAVIYLTYGMARIQNLVLAHQSTDLFQLTVASLVSYVIQLAYLLALGALFFALIFRMLMLWILVAFSPFIVMMMWWKEDIAGVKKYLSFEALINWAFVPAKVGAVFAISFIMISAGQSMGNITSTLVDNLESHHNFTFRIIGQESLFAGMGSLQDFLWLLMSLAVLWLGTFAVLGQSEKYPVVGGLLKSFGDGGVGFAKKALELPTVVPIAGIGSVQQLARKVNIPYQLGQYVDKQKGYGGDTHEDTVQFNRATQRMSTSQANEITRLMADNKLSDTEAKRIASMLKIPITRLAKMDQKTFVTGMGKHIGEDKAGALHSELKRHGDIAADVQRGVLGAQQENKRLGKGPSGDNAPTGTTPTPSNSPASGGGGTEPGGDVG